MAPVCSYVCACLCLRVSNRGRFIRHSVSAQKQGLIVNCTAIFLFCPVILCIDTSLPPAFLTCCSFALLIFQQISVSLSRPVPLLELFNMLFHAVSFVFWFTWSYSYRLILLWPPLAVCLFSYLSTSAVHFFLALFSSQWFYHLIIIVSLPYVCPFLLDSWL